MKRIIETKREIIKELQYQFSCSICGKESIPTSDAKRYCDYDEDRATIYTTILQKRELFDYDCEDFEEEIALCKECFDLLPEALKRIRR